METFPEIHIDGQNVNENLAPRDFLLGTCWLHNYNTYFFEPS